MSVAADRDGAQGGVGTDAPFVVEPFEAAPSSLTVFRATGSAEDFIAWASANRDAINRTLLRHGAILLRGFAMDTPALFERVIEACSDSPAVAYRERMTPRSHVAGDVWTSTDYPASQTIFFHNENSHCTSWPLKLFFCCTTPSETGGETPLVDCRKLTAELAPDLKALFVERKWMYARNFHHGVGFTWQSVYNAETREEVAAYCRENAMTPHWDGDKLTVRYLRSPMVRHPKTGEAIWFNHGTFYHPTTLEPRLFQAMSSRFAQEDFTYYSCFGDGTPIPQSVLESLRAAYHAAALKFPWQRGDVTILDNMLTAHGRTPFTGPRTVLVGMTERVQRSAVELAEGS